MEAHVRHARLSAMEGYVEHQAVSCSRICEMISCLSAIEGHVEHRIVFQL
jgi:hypothetical protein